MLSSARGWSLDHALPEKRKVDSSILSLTTSFGLFPSALTSANADWALSCLQLPSDHDSPCVTVVGRSLSHADRTPCLRAPGSRRLRPNSNLQIRRYLSGVQHRPDRSASWHDRRPPVRTCSPGAGSRSRGWLPDWLPAWPPLTVTFLGRASS
jgi:hypothetical protein